MQICRSSDSESPVKPRTVNIIAKGEQQFDSPSGITVWPYHDLARCEAKCVVKNAIRTAETIFQSGFPPRAKSYRPVKLVTTRPWPLCEPKSYALDPPFHIKPTPGSDAFEYISPKPFREKVLIPASTEVAKNPLSPSGGFKPPKATCALGEPNKRNAGKSLRASNQL